MKAFLAQGPIYIILSKFQAIYAIRAEHSSAVLIKVKSRNNIDSTKIEWDETPQLLQARRSIMCQTHSCGFSVTASLKKTNKQKK